MVGVSRSAGCQSCRKSRVKCDETKPLCGRCKRTGRTCAYPEKFKFLDETSKHLDQDCADEARVSGSLSQPKRGIFFYTTEKVTKNGSLFQKWHKSGLLEWDPAYSPPLTPTEMQGYRLMKCWNEGPRGMRFDLCAGWIKLVPPRLGNSRALDDAVRLLSNVHHRMLSEKNSSNWLCLASYAKALHSLQKAVVDPVGGYQIETMAAATILYHVEEIFGNNVYDYIKHAGGIGLLLEKRGTLKFETEFDWRVVVQNQSVIVSSSFVRGTPCFLSEPSWIEYFQSYQAQSEVIGLIQELAIEFSYWPTLVCKIRHLRRGILAFDELVEIRRLLVQIRSRMDAREVVIDKYIALDSGVSRTPTKLADSPLDEVYEFGHRSSWPGAIYMHCAYSFILDNMSEFVDNQCIQLGCSLQPICERARVPQKYQRLVSKVCRVYEWTSFLRPVMAGMSVLPLITAFQFAETNELRGWILRCLNNGDEHRQLQHIRYTPETLKYLNDMYIGAKDIPQAPGSSKHSQNAQYGNDSRSKSVDEDVGMTVE